MKKISTKVWKDPVGSKIIANSIWVLVLAIATSIYLLYQSISFSISFEQSWNNLITSLNKTNVISNWYILYAFIGVVILLVNRKITLGILKFLLTAPFGTYGFHNECNFTNQEERSTADIYAKRSFNEITLKPLANTKDWNVSILFSHKSTLLDSDLKCQKIVLVKKYHESILSMESFDSEGKIISEESKNLMTAYEDQEIKLSFDYSYEEGGILVRIQRLDNELIRTRVKYGCSVFKVIAGDSNYDFNLKIEHSRAE